jgi:uncharacterized phage protein gp47/JayE
VTFTARTYDEIVRDMLTTLTGGTVRESLIVPPDTLLMPRLHHHPVRRISHAEGQISVTVTVTDPENPSKKKKEEQLRPFRFTAADFELVSTTGKANDLDAIRFREKGRKPVPGSTLVVNYYPAQTEPVPLTDVNIGSVVRTLLETIGVELALTYQQLEHVYKSAFVETAESDALDKVVSLVGVQRAPGGRPVARLRFTRRAGTPGEVFIPTATPVTDDQSNRYLTVTDATMEAGESTREVTAMAESAATAEVAANTLTFFEIAIAGISEVTNPDPARRLVAPETDDQLRLRARGALRSTLRGTVDAMKFGLLAIDGVKDVVITERPNGIPGEIKVSVAYSDASDSVKAVVADRIQDLKPAGIIVYSDEAAKLQAAVSIELTLAGATLPAADVQALKDAVALKIDEALKAIPPGGTARHAQLAALALADTRVVDAKIRFTTSDRETDQLQLPEGHVLETTRPVVTASFEKEGEAPAFTATVTATLALNLTGAATQPQAQAFIESKTEEHLASRSASAPLTFDGLAVAIRNDSLFALVREDALVTIESQGKFQQLTDGVGTYVPAANEKLVRGAIVLDVRGTI